MSLAVIGMIAGMALGFAGYFGVSGPLCSWLPWVPSVSSSGGSSKGTWTSATSSVPVTTGGGDARDRPGR